MAYTLAQLQAIQDAIAKGELRVRFADREVIYRSMDDLLQAEARIARSLSTRPKQTLLVSDKGLGPYPRARSTDQDFFN